jgi:hypothetical protein
MRPFTESCLSEKKSRPWRGTWEKAKRNHARRLLGKRANAYENRALLGL